MLFALPVSRCQGDYHYHDTAQVHIRFHFARRLTFVENDARCRAQCTNEWDAAAPMYAILRTGLFREECYTLLSKTHFLIAQVLTVG